MNVQDIARTAHQVNKVYCESIGDKSQVDWDAAPDHIKKSVIDGVNFIINNPNAGPDASHNNWLKFKKDEGGWKYAPVKNLDKKEHPCFVEYNELPEAQKTKDSIFVSTVKSLVPFISFVENENNIEKTKEVGIVHSFGEDGKRYADLSNMYKAI